jgi:hypothetical protein
MVSQLQKTIQAEALLGHCWPNVAKAANELLRPVHLPNAVAAIGLNMDDVGEVLAHLPGDPAVKKRPYLRAYVKGQMVPSIERKIWTSPQDKRSSFDDWFRWVFDSVHSGFILNGAERWALGASAKLARWLRPQLLKADPLKLRLEMVLFAGDYGFTPFGVHRDAPCVSVIHFNLGPHAKDIYIFENEGDLPKFSQIRDAKRYQIKPGDGFLLPANYAHIGDSASFSVDIACKVMFQSDAEALAYVAGGLLEGGDAPDYPNLGELMLRRMGEAKRDESAGKVVDRWLGGARARARSNCHFIETPVSSTATWNDSSMVSVDDSFPIISYDCDEAMLVFSRGKSSAIFREKNLLAVLHYLLSNRSVYVRDILRCANSVEGSQSLIEFLIASRGVSVFSQ